MTLTIEVVGAEVLERFLERLGDTAVIGRPDFAGYENFGARNTGFLDAFADLSFIPVGL